MATGKQPIYLENDQLFKLSGFKDAAAGGSFLNTATVTITIRDTAGVEVPGGAFPATLDYVAASSGDYEGVIDKAIQVVEGQQYRATISAVEDTVHGEWIIELFGALREELT